MLFFLLFVIVLFFSVRHWFLKNDLRVGGPSAGDFGLSKLFAVGGYFVCWALPSMLVWLVLRWTGHL